MVLNRAGWYAKDDNETDTKAAMKMRIGMKKSKKPEIKNRK